MNRREAQRIRRVTPWFRRVRLLFAPLGRDASRSDESAMRASAYSTADFRCDSKVSPVRRPVNRSSARRCRNPKRSLGSNTSFPSTTILSGSSSTSMAYSFTAARSMSARWPRRSMSRSRRQVRGIAKRYFARASTLAVSIGRSLRDALDPRRDVLLDEARLTE